MKEKRIREYSYGYEKTKQIVEGLVEHRLSMLFLGTKESSKINLKRI